MSEFSEETVEMYKILDTGGAKHSKPGVNSSSKLPTRFLPLVSNKKMSKGPGKGRQMKTNMINASENPAKINNGSFPRYFFTSKTKCDAQNADQCAGVFLTSRSGFRSPNAPPTPLNQKCDKAVKSEKMLKAAYPAVPAANKQQSREQQLIPAMPNSSTEQSVRYPSGYIPNRYDKPHQSYPRETNAMSSPVQQRSSLAESFTAKINVPVISPFSDINQRSPLIYYGKQIGQTSTKYDCDYPHTAITSISSQVKAQEAQQRSGPCRSYSAINQSEGPLSNYKPASKYDRPHRSYPRESTPASPKTVHQNSPKTHHSGATGYNTPVIGLVSDRCDLQWKSAPICGTRRYLHNSEGQVTAPFAAKTEITDVSEMRQLTTKYDCDYPHTPIRSPTNQVKKQEVHRRSRSCGSYSANNQFQRFPPGYKPTKYDRPHQSYPRETSPAFEKKSAVKTSPMRCSSAAARRHVPIISSFSHTHEKRNGSSLIKGTEEASKRTERQMTSAFPATIELNDGQQMKSERNHRDGDYPHIPIMSRTDEVERIKLYSANSQFIRYPIGYNPTKYDRPHQSYPRETTPVSLKQPCETSPTICQSAAAGNSIRLENAPQKSGIQCRSARDSDNRRPSQQNKCKVTSPIAATTERSKWQQTYLGKTKYDGDYPDIPLRSQTDQKERKEVKQRGGSCKSNSAFNQFIRYPVGYSPTKYDRPHQSHPRETTQVSLKQPCKISPTIHQSAAAGNSIPVGNALETYGIQQRSLRNSDTRRPPQQDEYKVTSPVFATTKARDGQKTRQLPNKYDGDYPHVAIRSQTNNIEKQKLQQRNGCSRSYSAVHQCIENTAYYKPSKYDRPYPSYPREPPMASLTPPQQSAPRSHHTGTAGNNEPIVGGVSGQSEIQWRSPKPSKYDGPYPSYTGETPMASLTPPHKTEPTSHHTGTARNNEPIVGGVSGQSELQWRSPKPSKYDGPYPSYPRETPMASLTPPHKTEPTSHHTGTAGNNEPIVGGVSGQSGLQWRSPKPNKYCRPHQSYQRETTPQSLKQAQKTLPTRHYSAATRRNDPLVGGVTNQYEGQFISSPTPAIKEFANERKTKVMPLTSETSPSTTDSTPVRRKIAERNAGKMHRMTEQKRELDTLFKYLQANDNNGLDSGVVPTATTGSGRFEAGESSVTEKPELAAKPLNAKEVVTNYMNELRRNNESAHGFNRRRRVRVLEEEKTRRSPAPEISTEGEVNDQQGLQWNANCKVCKSNKISTISMPCYHKTLCKPCAQVCENCPECQGNIKAFSHMQSFIECRS